ncbi:MAG: rim15, signal transduction response regulator [Chaenotheca gracillima]|nr:MAG: rim15, signal transduction response regulator [Chaenotheca gracillima]
MNRNSKDRSLSHQAGSVTNTSRGSTRGRGTCHGDSSLLWQPGSAIVFAGGTSDEPKRPSAKPSNTSSFEERRLNRDYEQSESSQKATQDPLEGSLKPGSDFPQGQDDWFRGLKSRIGRLHPTSSVDSSQYSEHPLQKPLEPDPNAYLETGNLFENSGSSNPTNLQDTGRLCSPPSRSLDCSPPHLFGSSIPSHFTFQVPSGLPSLSLGPQDSFGSHSPHSKTIDIPTKGNLTAAEMPTEHEPPNGPNQLPETKSTSPQWTAPPEVAEFGKPSPLRSNLPFIMPKKHTSRPEHHRPDRRWEKPAAGTTKDLPPAQRANDPVHRPIDPLRPQYPSSQNAQAGRSATLDPKYAPPTDGDVVEIPRPNARPEWGSGPGAREVSYSRDRDVVQIPRPANYTSFQPVNPSRPTYSSFWGGNTTSNNVVDLTTNSTAGPEQGFFSSNRFGGADPYAFMDTAKANESIKALLEGTFDDEDSKPRTRLRRKKQEAVTQDVIEKMSKVDVNDSTGEGADVKTNLDKPVDEIDEEDDEDDGTVEGMEVKLLPHQVEGVSWMVNKEIGQRKNGTLPKGGILADDKMGLGKTLQSIALLLLNPRPAKSEVSEWKKQKFPEELEKMTLVVAPLALIKQWEKEIKSRVTESHMMKVCVHHGPQRTKRFQDLRKYDVVITTYQVLVSEHGSSSDHKGGIKVGCFGLHWYRVILDEAHTIKNRNAKATQACYALRSQYRWCLTGTPMQNNLDELQSLIRFLRIKPYNELSVWKDQITRPMAQGRGDLAMKRLQYFLKAFMKRRTKDILKAEGALVPGKKTTAHSGENTNGFRITERKIEKVLADFSPSEREFYKNLEQRTDRSLDRMMGDSKVSYASALVLLLRLRQVCNHPELIAGKLSKDKDALATGDPGQGKSPQKAKAAASKDVDDIADMLGGLSVETKQCESCLADLSKAEVSNGAIRCDGCAKDLKSYKQEKRHHKTHKRHQPGEKPTKVEAIRKPLARHRVPRVVDSEDDDEGEGDWVVAEHQRQAGSLGKAGGLSDEDAEGPGEDIGSEDSDSENGEPKSASRELKAKAKEVITLDESDEDTSSDSQDEVEDEFYSSGEDETRLGSLVISTKIRHLLGILHKESAQHKFIVFSQFTSMLDLIEPFLKRDGLVFSRYDGGMRNDLREASLDRLRTESRTRILLCSLKCGSLGLNLTAASRVVILEPFWNPFVEEQAIDRVHRLNQTVDVVVYKITVKDTVEERILDLQEKKRELANAAIEGKAVGKLSMKDILHLFRRDAEHAPQDPGYAQNKSWSSAEPLLGVAREQMSVQRGPRTTARVPSGSREDPLYGRRW